MVEVLNIEGEKRKTPDIHFDPKNGLMEISGMSCTENALDFYTPVLEWVDNFVADSPPKEIEINIKLIYITTASAKCIFDLLDHFGALKEKGCQLTINWFYEEDDEDMRIAGEEYSRLIEIPFNYKTM